MSAEPALERGWTSPEVAGELPGLALVACEARLPGGRRSPRATRERLAMLSNRIRGAQAVALRRAPVPAAFRVFYRHIGLDPDVTRTPVEEAVMRRLMHGGLRSAGLVEDALLIAVLETSVPVWALDADACEGGLGIRLAQAGEPLGRRGTGPPLAAGQLVIADERSAIAPLFGEPAHGHEVTRESRTAALFTIQVAGVPTIHVEEALWTCAAILGRE